MKRIIDVTATKTKTHSVVDVTARPIPPEPKAEESAPEAKAKKPSKKSDEDK